MPRHHKHRKDGNKDARRKDMERLGIGYLDIDGVYDGLALDRGTIYIIDFKNPDTAYGKNGWNENQAKKSKYLAKYGVKAIKILTSEDVLKLKNGEMK